MKVKFDTREDAITYYKENKDSLTKGATITLYKKITGITPKKGKCRYSMITAIDKVIKN